MKQQYTVSKHRNCGNHCCESRGCTS
jgi:hypothetical protein